MNSLTTNRFLAKALRTLSCAGALTACSAWASVATVNNDPVPLPEISAFFPIVGLIVAVSCTQILRRRRAAQQSAYRRIV
jgi:hypothetical protein